MIITGKYPNLRMRRSRKNSWSRRLVQENSLSYNDLILPIFLTDGSNQKIPIKSMPNIYRYSIDRLSKIIEKSIKKKNNAKDNKIPSKNQRKIDLKLFLFFIRSVFFLSNSDDLLISLLRRGF